MAAIHIEGAVALVTGANRGIGRAFVQGLLAAGAGRVYAASRDPGGVADLVALGKGRVLPLTLNITDPAQVAAVAETARDINLLINNAGIARFSGLIRAASLESAREEMETNYFGTLNVVRAFAPLLAVRGGGAIVNMVSIAALVNFPMLGSNSASKAALHSLTQCIRAELASQGTLVMGVYPGPVDNGQADMDVAKVPAALVVEAVVQALARGDEDVFPDPMAVEIRDAIGRDPKALEQRIAAMLES